MVRMTVKVANILTESTQIVSLSTKHDIVQFVTATSGTQVPTDVLEHLDTMKAGEYLPYTISHYDICIYGDTPTRQYWV